MIMSNRQAQELRDDIAVTRVELGETLQALAARADVRTRARASAVRAADRLWATWRTPAPWLMLTSVTAAVVAVVLARGDRRRW